MSRQCKIEFVTQENLREFTGSQLRENGFPMKNFGMTAIKRTFSMLSIINVMEVENAQ